MSDSIWRLIFGAAAIFNFAAGLPLLLVPMQALEMQHITPQPVLLFVQVSGTLIVMFGVGYAMVARNLALRELVWLGAIGKAIAFTVLTLSWTRGEIPERVFYAGFGDAIFALLFLWFLFGGRRSAGRA